MLLGNSLELLHSVCDERFPVIAVSEAYYAVGSDFLPVVLIYDIDSDQLLYEVDIDPENTHSMAFSLSGNNIALSTSNYDEGGFFDIDRNIEVRSYQTGEVLAELTANGDDAESVFLPLGSSVSFVTDETVLVTGVDAEAAPDPSQAFVYLWDWQTNVVERLEIEPNAMVEVFGSSDLVSIGLEQATSAQVRVIDLLGDLHAESSHNYDMAVGRYFETRLSSSSEVPLLAIENREGFMWVINHTAEQVIYSRKLERFATEVSFDHAGERIALGHTDGTIQLWDLQSDLITTIGNVFEE